MATAEFKALEELKKGLDDIFKSPVTMRESQVRNFMQVLGSNRIKNYDTQGIITQLPQDGKPFRSGEMASISNLDRFGALSIEERKSLQAYIDELFEAVKSNYSEIWYQYFGEINRD